MDEEKRKSCRGALTKQIISSLGNSWTRQEDNNMSSAEESTVLVVPVECAQKIRFELEKLNFWDATHKLKKLADSDEVAIPIIANGENLLVITDNWPDFKVARACLPISKKAKVKQSNPAVRLQDEIRQLLTLYGISEELLNEVPSKWERHDDLVIIPAHTFLSPKWAAIADHLWEVVAKCLGSRRLARHSAVANNGFRSSRVVMLRGQNAEVTHVDNGIRYTYDVTKCMFSPGNITEKIRVANLDCTKETVVDLYAGIGYFTLPYLIHARACHVHACEWNPDAVVALKHNLLINGVSERCTIHEGDNRMLQLSPLADRVNLGLIPSSEEGWPVAVQVLNSSGGILHIHGNVTIFHHRRALADRTEDCLHDELRQIDSKNASLSEKGSWQLHTSQKGKENVLVADRRNEDLSCICLEEANMTTAERGQDDRCVEGEKGSILKNCKDFIANPGTSEDNCDSFLSDGAVADSEATTSTFQDSGFINIQTDTLGDKLQCVLGDVRIQPDECNTYLASESLQHTSSKSPNSQLSWEFKNVASDGRNSVHSEDSKEDYCQIALQTCTEHINDNVLDNTNQKGTGKNVLLACEKWCFYVQRQIKSLLQTKKGGSWAVTKLHLEIVKSYAPHIVHAVLDLECRPVLFTEFQVVGKTVH